MLTKIVVLLAVLATTLAGKIPHQIIESFDQANSRIVGGTTAAEGQFPYQAILRNTVTFCGGSILSDRWIVTSQMCVLSTVGFVVIVGTTQPFNDGVTSMEVSQTVLHPNFDSTNFKNDIAMVQTVDTIVFSSTVQPIPYSSGTIGGGVASTVSGWGMTTVCYIDSLLRT